MPTQACGVLRLHAQQAPTPEGSVHTAGVCVGRRGSQKLGAAPTRGPRRRAGTIALYFPTPSKSKSSLLHVAHEVAPEPASHPPRKPPSRVSVRSRSPAVHVTA